MRIHETDTEEVRKIKRENNIREMAEDHQRASLHLPTGLPKDCKVEQPRDQGGQTSYKLGSGGYPVGNGDIRIRYLNGKNRYEYHLGFAGRARKQHEMNIGEGVNKSGLTFY